jgi:hypothetical protein
LFPPYHDRDALILITILDINHPLDPLFLDLISEIISRVNVESVCITYGFDLEETPDLSRAQLKTFDFQSYAGIGLLLPAASWYRAYLAGLELDIYQHQAGEITLFLGPSLIRILGIEAKIDRGANELFIPWTSPAPEILRETWLQNMSVKKSEKVIQPGQAVHTCEFTQIPSSKDPSVTEIQEALLPLGWEIKTLPGSVAVPTLSFKANRDKARETLGAKAFDQFDRLSRTLLNTSFEQMGAAELQQLEMVVLGMIGYLRESDQAEILIIRNKEGYTISLARPGIVEDGPGEAEQQLISRLKDIL